MIDAGFTYGGQGLCLVAIGLWAWLACTGLSLEARLLARCEDDLRFGAPPAAPDRLAWMSLLAYRVAIVAIVCRSIGFVIPD